MSLASHQKDLAKKLLHIFRYRSSLTINRPFLTTRWRSRVTVLKLTDKSVTADDVKAFGLDGLAKFKVPKYVKFVEEFPKTVTGKVKKFELRDQALIDFPHLKDELE